MGENALLINDTQGSKIYQAGTASELDLRAREPGPDLRLQSCPINSSRCLVLCRYTRTKREGNLFKLVPPQARLSLLKLCMKRCGKQTDLADIVDNTAKLK
jgi:hypothetical protein